MKSVLKWLLNISEVIYNFFIFKYFKVRYNKFPKIKGKVFIRNKGSFEIMDNVVINSKLSSNPIGGDTKSIFIVESDASLIIEEQVGISNSAIVCHNNIHICKNVYIGGSCRIYDTDFHSLNLNFRLSKNDSGIKTKPIRIEKGVFIGAGSFILKGVSIGEKSIIGAGSVVTKSIPPNQIWGGNPARFIRELTDHEKHII